MARIFALYAFLTVSSLLSLTSAYGWAANKKASAFLESATNLLPPSQDPFYTAPPGYRTAAPGAVLRIRQAPELPSVFANCSAVYNIVYRTTDSNYQPSWAVTTLFIPLTVSNASSNSTGNSATVAPGSALLSYQIPYDSANVDQSPSYTFYGAASDPSIPTALGYGWYVNVPDYEGPLASFTAGVQSGHATIDSVRAVLNSGFGLSSNARYALWGYSGGALASEWAAELAVQYAPEMTFAGIALGGLTPNVTSVTETINGSPFAELVVNGILGITSQDPAAQQYILSQLRPTGQYNASAFLAARNATSAADVTTYVGQNIFDYFISGIAILQNPVLTTLLNRDGQMGYHGTPAMPVFAYKAIADEISVVADTDALVNRYCGVDANILYQRNTVGGHVAEAFNGGPRALAFLSAVLSGTYGQLYQTMGCTIQNVTVELVNIPD